MSLYIYSKKEGIIGPTTTRSIAGKMNSKTGIKTKEADLAAFCFTDSKAVSLIVVAR